MNAQHTVTLRTKRNGAYDLLMPACPTSEIFARLSGSSNITKPCVAAMKALGYAVEVVQQDVKVI